MSRRSKLPLLGESCPNCLAPYEPHSTGVSRCTVCMRYSNLSTNSGIERRDGSSPGLDMTLQEFASWFTDTDRSCAYCLIPEALVPSLGLKTKIGLPLVRLGVDRLDNALPYSTSNIALCCLACNATKSNTFNGAEMEGLGEALQTVWKSRLAASGIDWHPSSESSSRRTGRRRRSVIRWRRRLPQWAARPESR